MNLRYYQQETVDAFLDHWGGDGGNALAVLATGTGKSLIAATLAKQMVQAGARVGIVTHVRELVRQNAMALLKAWPQADFGIYSAGLNRKDGHRPVTFASIQSIYKKAEILGPWDLILVDEVHLVPTKAVGTYRRFIAEMMDFNSEMRVGGLTATPFRLGEGRIDSGNDRIFESTVYNYGIAQGIADGFLSPLVSKRGSIEIDVSRVGKTGGDFKQGELEAASRTVTDEAVAELVERGTDRRSWLVFCAGVQHAHETRDAVRKHGISCEVVHSDTPSGERDRIVERFKAGEIRCLTNANVLTTGFDSAGIDLVGMMRSTLSTSLYVQMVGRGTRLAPGKSDCLVLDWAGNVRRHGPVDVAEPAKDDGGSGNSEGRVAETSVLARECPVCQTMEHISVPTCRSCGYEWPRNETPKHEASADAETPILSTEKVPPRSLPVVEWMASRHERPGATPSMRVTIHAGVGSYSEWVTFEHSGFALQRSQQWWTLHRGKLPFPKDTTEAIERFEAAELTAPASIAVERDGKYHRIVSRVFASDDGKAAA